MQKTRSAAGRKSFWLKHALLAAIVIGCGGPKLLPVPEVNADAAAKLALDLYDTNRDGRIGDTELTASPALKATLASIDTNRDRAVDAAELARRIESWSSHGTGLTRVDATFRYQGKPLADAQIEFRPEPFLGGAVQTARGTTNSLGYVRMSIPREQIAIANIEGMHFGLYTVVVSKLVDGKETMPAKFNTASTLGQEIADDVGELREGLEFNLTP